MVPMRSNRQCRHPGPPPGFSHRNKPVWLLGHLRRPVRCRSSRQTPQLDRATDLEEWPPMGHHCLRRMANTAARVEIRGQSCQLQYRLLLGSHPQRFLGALHRLGIHRRMVARLSRAVQSAFSRLGLAESPCLCGLHHPSTCAGGRLSIAPQLDRARAGQILRRRPVGLHRYLAAGRPACPDVRRAPSCLITCHSFTRSSPCSTFDSKTSAFMLESCSEAPVRGSKEYP